MRKQHFRAFGPVSTKQAEFLVEHMLDQNPIRNILVDYLSGKVDAQALAFAVDVISEELERDQKESA